MSDFNPTPAVNCRYGAPMGRVGTMWSDPDWKVRFRLKWLALYGDYDRGGAYWGRGTPLWCAWSEEELDGERAVLYLRADSREQAKADVRERFAMATFYR